MQQFDCIQVVFNAGKDNESLVLVSLLMTPEVA